MTAPLSDLVLYSRAGCGLCDEARGILGLLIAERVANGEQAPAIREVDIATDLALERSLFDRIPVVEFSGRRVELTSSPLKLRRLLEEGLADASPVPAR